MPIPNKIFDKCWLFIRGDMATGEFEQWVYVTPELEEIFPESLYMSLISIDYSKKGLVYVLKQDLKNQLIYMVTRDCECHTLRDLAVVDMGYHDHIFKSLNEKAVYGESLWWLWLAQCSACEQFWLVGSEERINDVFVMKRVSTSSSLKTISHGVWPNDFKKYDTLLRIARDQGHSVRFVDPVSPALVNTVIDLAKAKPGIALREIARLLQVDLNQAKAIAEVAMRDADISITQ